MVWALETTTGRSLQVLSEGSKSKIVQEVEALPTTLLAQKFGTTRYEEIEANLERWVAWVKENYDTTWVNWLDALEAFQAQKGTPLQEDGTVEDNPKSEEPKAKEKPKATKAKGKKEKKDKKGK